MDSIVLIQLFHVLILLHIVRYFIFRGDDYAVTVMYVLAHEQRDLDCPACSKDSYSLQIGNL